MELALRTESATNSYSQDSNDESSGDPMPALSAPPPYPPSPSLYYVPDFLTSWKAHRSSTLALLVIYLAVSFTTTYLHILAFNHINNTVNMQYVLLLVSFEIIFNGSLLDGVITRNILVLRIQQVITTVFEILITFVLLLLFILIIGFLVLQTQERMEVQMLLELQFLGYSLGSVGKLLFLVTLGVVIGALELHLRSCVIKKIIREIRAETQQLQFENPSFDV